MHSEEEPKDSGVGSLIAGVEVAETILQLRSSTTPGILTKLLKALDVVGLSLLTRLCNIVGTSETVPLEWQTGVVPIFMKGDHRVCSNYWGITLLSLPEIV